MNRRGEYIFGADFDFRQESPPIGKRSRQDEDDGYGLVKKRRICRAGKVIAPSLIFSAHKAA